MAIVGATGIGTILPLQSNDANLDIALGGIIVVLVLVAGLVIYVLRNGSRIVTTMAMRRLP